MHHRLPLRRVRGPVEFSAQQGGRSVPVRLALANNDALFTAKADPVDDPGAAVLDLTLGRSNSVLIFAAFMMAAMWALALAVLVATWFLVSRRRGLVWPALGWMAATLFALAAFRNTAPGSRPIGCVLDCIAFLWVEPVIAFCVVTVVTAGARAESQPTEKPSAPAV
ncbi:DUF4436 family protein [Streptomyces sp. G-G2]|uniref:DUF4436 family protein n=1 Tax=Streptomyces sp. G-G2 TaxID=3046201 RepID=UPI0032D917CB